LDQRETQNAGSDKSHDRRWRADHLLQADFDGRTPSLAIRNTPWIQAKGTACTEVAACAEVAASTEVAFCTQVKDLDAARSLRDSVREGDFLDNRERVA
jgi:hypothetical protein